MGTGGGFALFDWSAWGAARGCENREGEGTR